MSTGGIRFSKGHGTQNDFVVLPDPDAARPLPAAQVALLCDRRAGIGGDGVLRVVRTEALLAAGELDAAAQPLTGPGGSRPEWFMDYRNADGSIAEMCGNGIRVFVAYLLREGLVRLADGEVLDVGTRAGVKQVRRSGALLAADLGPWHAAAEAAVTVDVAGEPAALPGLAVDVGNPHVVVALPDDGRLSAADLHRAPVLTPAPPAGANVELIVPLPPEDGRGRLLMRVHERGSGETRSCGTGAVAAVLAARVWGAGAAPDRWDVEVPGGHLEVRVPGGELTAGARVELAGPAAIVADGEIDPALLEPGPLGNPLGLTPVG